MLCASNRYAPGFRMVAPVYAADFETTTDPDDCRVWHWGVKSLEEVTINRKRTKHRHTVWGTDIATFVDFLAASPKISRSKARTITMYFHNLKFDGRFILDFLLKNGWEYYKREEGDRTRMLPRGTLECLYSDSSFYTLTLGFATHTVKIVDSLKKCPMSIRAMSRAYGLTMAKGEIDYEKPRPVGYEPTKEELEYLEGDITILADVMRIQRDNGLKGITIASDAIKDWKKRIPLRGGMERQPSMYRVSFPKLSTPQTRSATLAYRGGWTFAAPAHRHQEITQSGMVFDVNSLYPSVMYDRPLPYSCPRHVTQQPDGGLWIGRFTLSGSLRPGGVQCFPVRSKGVVGYDYATTFENEDIYATSVDFYLWEDMYDLEVESASDFYVFNPAPWPPFKDYIDFWMGVKEEATRNGNAGLRTISKLYLNSLYGKFGSRTTGVRGTPYIDMNDTLRFRNATEEREPQYMPMAAFITAYARDVTIRAAAACGDRFCYADTDSLHIIGTDMPDIDVDPVRLGAWKHESVFTRAYYAGPKRYMELIDGVWDKHVAGMPAAMAGDLTIHDFQHGRVFTEGKLVPRPVPGGVVLVNTPFEITGIM